MENSRGRKAILGYVALLGLFIVLFLFQNCSYVSGAH